jgi:hypothetical protein
MDKLSQLLEAAHPAAAVQCEARIGRELAL